MFTNDERTDMILIFGECRKNAEAAAKLYRHRYPNRRTPSDKVFERLEAQLRKSWPPIKRRRAKTATNNKNQVAVFKAIALNPDVSQRLLARNLGISPSSVSRIIRTTGSDSSPINVKSEKVDENEELGGDDSSQIQIVKTEFY